jgi:Leucine-rich repeat (LRR) protein
MEKLACLEQLYISNNGIEVLENLEENGSLTTIDLASNRISQLDNLQSLQNVEEFWFNDNLVPFSCSILIDLIMCIQNIGKKPGAFFTSECNALIFIFLLRWPIGPRLTSWCT